MKKALGVLLTVLAASGFYLVGKALEIDVIGQFAPYIATAVVGWIVFYAEKWFGLKLEFLDSEFTRQKVSDAIVWAEGKAIEEFKLNKFITDGKQKGVWALSKLIETLPNLDEQTARSLIDNYFPLIRSSVERMWFEIAEEAKVKAALKKKVA